MADQTLSIDQQKALALASARKRMEESSAGGEGPSVGIDVAKGAGSGLAQGAIGLVTGPIDLGMKGGAFLANKALEVAGQPEQEYPPSLTDMAYKAAGIDYHPQTVPGEYASTISSFLPAFVALSEGNPLALQNLLKAARGAGVTGATSETAGQLTKGTEVEPYARMAGAVGPGLLKSGASAATKKILRGGATPEEIERNANTFKKSGTSATVGQATGGYVPQAIESFLSKVPGGSGIMNKFARKQGEDIGSHVDKLAKSLSPSSSGAQAGAATEKGITEKFIPQARQEQNRLYSEIDKFIPPNSMVEAKNTEKVLANITKGIPGAENLSQTKLLSNPVISEVQTALKKDMGGTPGIPSKPSIILQGTGSPFIKGPQAGIPPRNTMPYVALKELRTRIGQKIETVDLAPDVPKAQLKRLYGALTEDMKIAAYKAGPHARAAFDKANDYTKKFHEKIDQMQSVIDKGDPEKVFRAAMAGTAEGASTLKTIMKSLPPDSRKTFSAAVLRRMGRATPSNQNDIGNVFSTNTFLTNWNKLSPEAKSTLFDGYGAGFSNDMDRIAKVANNIKEGSSVFRNPSGTAPSEELINTGKSVGAAVIGFMLGHVTGLGIAMTGIGASNVGARMFTDPRMVQWLAEATKMPTSSAPAALASLNKLMQGDEDGTEEQKPGGLRITIPRPPQWGLDNVLHQQTQQQGDQ